MDLRLWGLHGDTRQRMRRHGSQVMQRGSAKATEESGGGRSFILGSPRNNCCVTRLPASPTGSADDTACYKSRVTYLMTVTAAQVPRGSSVSAAIDLSLQVQVLCLCSVPQSCLPALECWMTSSYIRVDCYAATVLGPMAVFCGLSLCLLVT